MDAQLLALAIRTTIIDMGVAAKDASMPYTVQREHLEKLVLYAGALSSVTLAATRNACSKGDGVTQH